MTRNAKPVPVSKDNRALIYTHIAAGAISVSQARRCTLSEMFDLLVKSHLRASEQMHVPLLVPRGSHGQLGVSDDPHNVRHAVVDETNLAAALVVRTVEARTADGSFFD